MDKFTVKVDLSKFFEDERKSALILVDPAWSTVENFQKRIEELFDLKRVRFQTVEGCLVPSQESIEIIKYVHELRVFAGKLRKRNKQLKANKDDNNLLESVETSNSNCHQGKRKFISLENGLKNASSNSAKRSKNWSSTLTVARHNESNEITSTQNDNNVLKDMEQRVSAAKDESEQEMPCKASKKSTSEISRAPSEHINETQTMNKSGKSHKISNGIQSFSSQKSKRKSKSFASSTLIEFKDKNYQKQQNLLQQTNRSHIYFNGVLNSSDNNNSQTVTLTNDKTNALDSKSNVIFRCALEEVSADTTARVFKISKRRTKSPIIIQEQLILQKSLLTEVDISENVDVSVQHNASTTDAMISSASILEESEIIQEEALPNSTNVSKTANETDKPNATTIETMTSSASILEDSKIIQEKSLPTSTYLPKNADETDKANATTTDELTSSALNPEESKNESIKENTSHADNSSVVDLDQDSDSAESVIELNESDDDEPSQLETSDKENNAISIAKMLGRAINLTKDNLPSIGDILFFRLSYNNKGPVISDYVAGTCEYVNKRSKTFTVCIADGKQELPNLSPIYGCNLDDSMTISSKLSVKLVDMIAPKMIKMN